MKNSQPPRNSRMKFVLPILILLTLSTKADTVTVNAHGIFPEFPFSFTASYDWDTVTQEASKLTFSQEGLDLFSVSVISDWGANFTNDMGDILQIDFLNWSAPRFPEFGSYPSFDMDIIYPEPWIAPDYKSDIFADDGTLLVTDPPSNTPEPSTALFFIVGFVLALCFLWREWLT